MARPHRAVTRIPRGMNTTISLQMGELWNARLQVSAVPAPEDLAWQPEVIDPLMAAGSIAVDLHELCEAPPHRARQPRAVLQALAMAALRKTE